MPVKGDVMAACETQLRMGRWHAVFEAQPEAHQDFLESLGVPAAEAEAM